MPDLDLSRIQQIVNRSASPSERLQEICAYLHHNVPYYNWVGIYRADNERRELLLGPFVGAPTEHGRIPFGRGVCGQAAEKLVPIIIQDVSAEDNYLTCSLAVKAEIVIPIFYENRFVGELDIDSHYDSPFSTEDRRLLEKVAQLIAHLIEV